MILKTKNLRAGAWCALFWRPEPLWDGRQTFQIPPGHQVKTSDKIVNNGPITKWFEDFFHEFQVCRMDLIRLFRRLIGENDIQRHLI